MQTVKFNRKALLALVGGAFLFLCLLSYYPFGSGEPPRVIRHLENRHAAQLSENQRVNRSEIIKLHVDPTKSEELSPKKTEIEEAKKEDAIPENGKLIEGSDEDVKRREFVKQMMIHAWGGYRNYSWGANEVGPPCEIIKENYQLRPNAKAPNSQSIFGGKDMPATIVDAADTLWIMGLTDQYKEARDYIQEHMSMSKATGTLSVFETTIRFLGGLLSLYALTKEEFYIEKAKQVGDALLPAFNTPTGIPKSNIDMKTKYVSNYGWAAGGMSILSEIGSLNLEFEYLSEVTKQPIFAKKVRKVRDALDKVEKDKGLYSNYISPDSGKWSSQHHVSLGALGDSFYEYLIKSWVQSNKTDDQAHRMYWNVSEAIRKHMVFKSRTGLTYVAELRGGNADHKMGHLACFCVGMFALQAVHEKTSAKRIDTMEFAEQLGSTCHESYIRSETHIGPEMFYFTNTDDATSRKTENGYIQRPEVIEGWFYLWRLTGKPIYKDWVWDAVKSIEKWCRVDAGYVGLRNVYNPSAGQDDVQQSFFLAETLKYAYLTFTDNSVISLDEWVFNTEAHPLPVMNVKF